jgi:deoxycytidine triphosphate deaminase
VRKKATSPSQILTRTEMSELFDSGQIFRPATSSKECIRTAAYDLRMATDFMVVPDRPAYPAGRFYPKGTHRSRPVVLSPGDVAFVSSAERCALPWNITGTVGSKFSLTAQGLLILTGLFVDPGYGMVRGPDGEWMAADNQRLHFLIANVGSLDVVLIPGEQRIAAVQFQYIESPEPTDQIESYGLRAIEEQYLNPETAVSVGLVFFRNIAELKELVQKYVGKSAELEARLAGVETGSNQVVMFGVFLLCITLVGIIFELLLTAANSTSISTQIAALNSLIVNYWPGTIVSLVLTVFASIGVLAVMRMFYRLIARR